MRRSIRTALVGAVLAGSLAVSAAAADYTACADSLQALGLFQGTEQGYDLDRAPTRAEAAVMLIRLLGEEANALALEYTAPFTDLESWQQPYIQYLYENGLTTGTSDTAYAPEQLCSAQMYAAFMLRALDYSEAEGDFAYNDAVAFAQQIGLYDPAVVDTTEFLRDDAAAASYTALSLQPKNVEDTLLDQLVADGAVDAAAAETYQSLFETYALYREATAGMKELTQFSVRGGVTVKQDDGMTLTTQDCIAVDRENGTATAEGTLTLKASNMEPYTQPYYMDAAQESGNVRAALLYGYGAVPLACVENVEHAGLEWIFSFTALPAQYDGGFWALAHSGGVFEQARPASLVQTVQNGRVSSQTLTVELTQGDAVLHAVWTGKLDTAK